MRAGWDDGNVNAPSMARMMEDAGAAAVAVHGRTAKQSYSGESDWGLIRRVAAEVTIPVLGSGDCVTPEQMVDRSRTAVAGVLVGRGALRNPWIFQQAAALAAGNTVPAVSLAERGRFLLEYIDLLLREGLDESRGFRHHAPGMGPRRTRPARPARSHERWVVNKLRALGSWYTKGIHGGSGLRTAINCAASVEELRAVIRRFFLAPALQTANE
jgi:tRNA-dihydrouridine synthase B